MFFFRELFRDWSYCWIIKEKPPEREEVPAPERQKRITEYEDSISRYGELELE